MWKYVFRVSSIFVCPKYFATNVTLAPLLINRDARECLKSWILICLTPASCVYLFLVCRNICAGKGSLSPNTTYLKIWLQRITIPLDRNKKYSEGSICEKICNKESTIWNSEWLKDNVKKVFDENLIINEKEIESLELDITSGEVDVFSVFHES